MNTFETSFKTPYDTIVDVIEKWCQDNYYGNFLVTLRINGELCAEYLIYETGDPDRLDPHWVWEFDWWEGQKDVKLVGFIDINSVHVSGTPDNYKFLEEERINTLSYDDELLKAAKAMHTWIFLNSADEQEAYEKCGLSDEMNAFLGYGGQFMIELSEEEPDEH